MTQVIAGQYPRPSGNLPRPPDFDSANGGKDSSQKIHHRPVRQIDHSFFLADREKEPEKYRTLSPDRPCRAGIPARLVPGAHKWSPYICAQASIPCRAGILARLTPSAHEWSPYICAQASTPCRAGILPASSPATTNGRPTFALKSQSHVGRASCPPRLQRPRMVALHKKQKPPGPNHWSQGFCLRVLL